MGHPLAWFLTLAAAQADGGAWVVDRLVAVVPEASTEKAGASSEATGRKPITASELDFEARVDLIRQGGIAASSGSLDDEVLARTLDYVIGQDLAMLEIQRLKIEEPEAQEVDRELKSFQRQFPSAAAYQAFLGRFDPGDPRGAEDALVAILKRDLKVAKYFDRRIRLLARVDEVEVKKYIAEHPQELAAMDRQSAMDLVRTKLTRERATEVTRREMDAIRERHRFEVQLIARFAHRPAPSDARSSADGRTP